MSRKFFQFLEIKKMQKYKVKKLGSKGRKMMFTRETAETDSKDETIRITVNFMFLYCALLNNYVT